MSARRADPFTVALVQHAPVFLNLEATVSEVEALVPRLAAAGAAVAVFPETWLPGYPVWIDSAPEAALWNHPGAKALYRVLAGNAVEHGGEAFLRLQAASDAAGVVLVIGAHERLGATLYNTTFSFDGHGGHVLHRKLTPTYTERLLWGSGDGSTLDVLDSPHGVIGGLICWEHWMPLARAAMHARHEVLHVAQWPWVHQLHQVCSRHYAFEGQCFVAASGGMLSRGQALHGLASVARDDGAARELLESIPGDDDTLLLQGGSALIGPDIGYVIEPVLGEETILYGEIDPARIDEGRMFLDTDGHYSRPDVFRLHVDTRPHVNVIRHEGGE